MSGIPLHPSQSLSITQCIYVGCHTRDRAHTPKYGNVTCRNLTHKPTHTHVHMHAHACTRTSHLYDNARASHTHTQNQVHFAVSSWYEISVLVLNRSPRSFPAPRPQFRTVSDCWVSRGHRSNCTMHVQWHLSGGHRQIYRAFAPLAFRVSLARGTRDALTDGSQLSRPALTHSRDSVTLTSVFSFSLC